jgi:hypothetical protein
MPHRAIVALPDCNERKQLMTEHTANEGVAHLIAATFVADRVMAAGIVGICKRLIAKGVFNRDDVDFVVAQMRLESTSSAETASDVVLSSGLIEAQVRTIDEIDNALRVACSKITEDLQS